MSGWWGGGEKGGVVEREGRKTVSLSREKKGEQTVNDGSVDYRLEELSDKSMKDSTKSQKEGQGTITA